MKFKAPNNNLLNFAIQRFDMFHTAITTIQVLASAGFGVFSFVVLMIGVSSGYSVANGPVAVKMILLFLAWIVLSVNEGFQVAVLRIHAMNVHSDIRAKGFLRAAAIHSMIFPANASTAENPPMKRMLIGQSFFVVLCSFTIANITTFTGFGNMGSSINSTVLYVFFCSGLPGVFITITLAQLLPSILAKKYPLVFLNLPGVFTVVRLALVVESLGVVQVLFPFVGMIERCCCLRIAGPEIEKLPHLETEKEPVQTELVKEKDIEEREATSQENPMMQANSETQLEIPHNDLSQLLSEHNKMARSPALSRIMNLMKLFCEASKYVASFAATSFSLFFIAFALLRSYSSFAAPVIVQLLILCLALTIIFYCEGLKIAVIKTATFEPNKFPHGSENVTNDGSERILALVQDQGGVERFMLGRQLIVVPLGFIVAQITHFGGTPTTGTVWSEPLLYFLLVDVGLPGILTLLQFSQLTPQLLAESHGKVFLKLPGSYSLIRLALLVEMVGITQMTTFLVEIIDRFSSENSLETDTMDEKTERNLPNTAKMSNKLLLSNHSYGRLTDVGESINDIVRV